VYAQELLVHDRGEGQGAKRLDTCVVHALGVLVLAFGLEREVVGQVAALMVATEEEERVRIPDLEGPKVQ
jgi:hypothetical protein